MASADVRPKVKPFSLPLFCLYAETENVQIRIISYGYITNLKKQYNNKRMKFKVEPAKHLVITSFCRIS